MYLRCLALSIIIHIIILAALGIIPAGSIPAGQKTLYFQLVDSGTKGVKQRISRHKPQGLEARKETGMRSSGPYLGASGIDEDKVTAKDRPGEGAVFSNTDKGQESEKPKNKTADNSLLRVDGPDSSGGEKLPDDDNNGNAKPVKTVHIDPRYPPVARRNNWEGTTILELAIKSDGRVGDVIVLVSSGHEILDQAAVEAARKWRYKPLAINGTSKGCRIRVKISFELEG